MGSIGQQETAFSTRERNPYYTVFPFGWYGVCYSDALPAGEIKTLHYLGRELVAWRGLDGAPQVADAFCPHLGGHLGDGKVEQGCIVCPFHGWHWDREGRNTLIPYSDGTHPRARLGTFPTMERNGLVMMWFHPQGEPPSFDVPEIPQCDDPAYRCLERARWRMHSTWQETAENGADYVHLRFVHNTPEVPEVEEYLTTGPVNRVRLKVNYYSPRGDTPGYISTATYGPGFSVAHFTGITDLYMINWPTPVDFEVLEDNKSYLVHRDKERVGQSFVRDLKMQMEQDIAIFNKKRFLEKPALVKDDGPIAKFRRWAGQFYVAEGA